MTADSERVTVVHPPRDDLGHVAGFAITDELIVMAGGTSSRKPIVLASSNARHFERRATPRELGLRDILVVGDMLWTCGEYGQLASSRDRGASWALVETGTEACLFALELASDGAVWVVGDVGYAARVVGDRLERVDLQTTTKLAAIYAVRDELVILGLDGALRRWRNGTIISAATGATRSITSLAITKHGTWIVVGDGGFVARSPDGQWFSRAQSGVDTDLEALAALGDGRIVAVGDRGQILISTDDGRNWRVVASALTAHLWAVEPFGGGVLIGGDGGLVAKLAPDDDQTWNDRVNVFGGAKPFDRLFASGPDAFVTRDLARYLDAVESDAGPAHEDDDDRGDDDDDDDDGDREPPLGEPGNAATFEANYGVAMPAEVVELYRAVADRHVDLDDCFDELRIDNQILPDVGERNLFELIVRRDQREYLGTGLVEAFCGVFCVGLLGNGDTYHLELNQWDGPPQVLHYDHETHAFTGVFADSLDSLVYLAALCGAKEAGTISQDAFAVGVRKLRGRIAPTWHFAIDTHDPEFTKLDPKRRDTEFFFYRSRWICALLKDDGITEIDDIPQLFMADFNQIVPQDQLAARFDACEKFTPTALYSMWRAFLFDEPELGRYLEIGRHHAARLVRDAAALIDELRAGRNELGTIKDVRAHLAAFRALDLDPRRADARKLEANARASAATARTGEALAQLAETPPAGWAELAWRWLDDGVAHRTLLERLDREPAFASQIQALDALRELADNDREIALPRLAAALAPELEALLVGSLLRRDTLDGVLARSTPPAAPDEPDDSDEDAPPDPERVRAALAMTERALRLVPDDPDAQFTHAMLLIDADRVAIAGMIDVLLRALPDLEASVRINVAVRMGKAHHARFGDAVDAVLPPDLSTDAYADVPDELFSDLADTILAHVPARLSRLIPILPGDVSLLSALAWKAIQAVERGHALALYDRVLELPIPEDGEPRTNYLRALNNACVQAHAARAYETAVRIADRAQPVAHENPYIYHSAACAYAAVGDYAKAFHQVKLAVAHEYDQLGKVEVDADLGPLLDWPEFKELFRDWHARQEGN